MPRIVMLLFVAFAVIGCGRRSVPPLSPSLYAYWTLEALPNGPPSDGVVPTPTASAILVAPGYLLTSIEGMGDVADDFGMDPTVYVFDGASWHTGRYVDRDTKLNIALISADVPGTPVRISRAAVRPSTIVGISPFEPTERRESSVGGLRCPERRRSLRDDFGMLMRMPTVCIAMLVGNLPGGAMLGDDGSLAAVQTSPYGAGESAGPDAAEIRDFLDLYFATWGAAVRPKPEY
jgi:hypothetical protein